MNPMHRYGAVARAAASSLVTVGVAAMLAVVGLLMLPDGASAQGLGGIAGIARDTSGAVLPGVTVEASSPALIEKVRSTVTDGEGRYTFVSLPPGTYSVMFTLPGFRTFRRDDIPLQAGFTATVNAEMTVGALEETITVSGEAPLIDTRNVGSRRQVSAETLEVLPSGNMDGGALIAMTPGITGTPQVGGTGGYRDSNGTGRGNYHGRYGNGFTIDGMSTMSALAQGTYSYVPNPLLFAETTVEAGGSAENASDPITFNAVPKEGSNTFNGTIEGYFANSALEGANVTDELRRQGVRDAGKLAYNYQIGGTWGGPIAQDKVWFFTAAKFNATKRYDANTYFNATQGTVFYTPDLARQAFRDSTQRTGGGRVTWQVTPRNKLNLMLDYQANCECRGIRTTTDAPEARGEYRFFPSIFAQGLWTTPLTNRLLLEAGASGTISHWSVHLNPEVTADSIAINDVGIGIRYGLNSPSYPRADKRWVQRVALSYVTGSHTAKVGVVAEEITADYGIGYDPKGRPFIGDRSYTFANQVPTSITLLAQPYTTRNRAMPSLGAFAQDQWVLARVTLNYGLRFDYFNGYVAEQEAPANPYMPARSYPKVSGVPNWMDFSPRAGLAWDLFGTGRSAVKVSVGRYVFKDATSVADALNPFTTTVASTNRAWSDVNRNFVPDCDLANFAENGECGPIANRAFGQSQQVYAWDENLLEGFGARPADWDASIEFQQQLTDGMSVTLSYDHNWSTNFRVADNLAVEASDFDTYCVTAPQSPLLPGGGGYQVCGLYDVSPAKFGQQDFRVRRASNYGSETRVGDFVGINMDARLGGGAFIRGGVDFGRTKWDNCEIRAILPELAPLASGGGAAGEQNGVASSPTNPFCNVADSVMGNLQAKFQGSYVLPWEVTVSAILQNVPTTSINAIGSFSNAEIAPSLGRNLSACGARTIATCTARVNITLVAPGTNWQDRLTQLDLRFSKTLRMGGSALQASVDLYNALNAAAVLGYNASIGAQFGRPQSTLGARLVTLNGRWSF